MVEDVERVVRVAAVPTEHPYVRAVLAEAPGVEVLPEPVVRGRPAGQWWPPVLLDPTHLRAHASDFDVLHVHFGMESVPTARLREALVVLEELDVPLVFTLHDLANPQLTDQTAHRTQLDAMVECATELITLTPGAAAEIRRRWGRDAAVIPHPRLALSAGALALSHPGLESGPGALALQVGLAARPTGRALIGVHLRDLRPNIAGERIVRQLASALEQLPAGTEVRLRLNERVRDEEAAETITALAARVPGLSLERGPRQTDAELERWISQLDAVVLPYRHGTHSGFAELCWDLGVPVVDSGVGFVAEQHPADTTRFDLDDESGRSLAGALESVRPVEPAVRRRLVLSRRTQRAEQSKRIGKAHREVYDRALAARRVREAVA